MDAEQQEARHTLDLFVSVLGHDLRDPLAAVMAAAGLLLRRGELTDLQKRNILRIKSSSERMARMIGDVLEFARGRTGHMELRTAEANLHDLCRQVVDEFRLANPEREVQLHLEGHPEGRWDVDRLAQVISNLLSNANHYSPEGRPIALSSGDHEGGVYLSVFNQGPPISPERLAGLFDPFRRGDLPDRAHHSAGLGLGLYIVHSIVEAHGGQVQVRSHEEGGTTFTVKLPLAPSVL
jgi:phosphoserine phosphatase RsbU/P